MAIFPETNIIKPGSEAKASLANIKDAYDIKINSYVKLLDALEKDKERLLRDITKGTVYINDVMRKAEKIGIDEMNHKTIIAMLKEQYIKWFGETPEASPECPEGLEKYLKGDTIL